MTLGEQVQVELDLAEILLRQTTEFHFPAFVVVAGALNFDRQAEVDRVLTRFGELKHIFPLDIAWIRIGFAN
ncbi:hypothetical protein [Aromatoleum evansii]|uniref:hypothetical protein n=1 Tax=Aromatoleum evansii TaxID=59406 RepID=UPI00145CC189|nr:hypothetical protein [Aromatoleum evansii]NMG29944.1 hypothetical protein [Aromatoleum evansii]